MFDLTLILVLFFLSVIAHLGICRREGRDVLLIRTFFGISALAFGIFLICWFIFHHFFPASKNSLWNTPLFFSVTILYILLCFLYLSFYVNVKLNSPSKSVMTLIREKKSMNSDELGKFFTDSEFIEPRLADLVMSGCVSKEGDRYRLSRSGERIGRILEIYQKIVGRPIGG